MTSVKTYAYICSIQMFSCESQSRPFNQPTYQPRLPIHPSNQLFRMRWNWRPTRLGFSESWTKFLGFVSGPTKFFRSRRPMNNLGSCTYEGNYLKKLWGLQVFVGVFLCFHGFLQTWWSRISVKDYPRWCKRKSLWDGFAVFPISSLLSAMWFLSWSTLISWVNPL